MGKLGKIIIGAAAAGVVIMLARSAMAEDQAVKVADFTELYRGHHIRVYLFAEGGWSSYEVFDPQGNMIAEATSESRLRPPEDAIRLGRAIVDAEIDGAG